VYFTPVLSNSALGEFRLRPVFDIRRDHFVPPSLNGQRLELQPLSNGNYRLGIPGSFDYSYGWLVSVMAQRFKGRIQRFVAKRRRAPS
jgi:hypothetical protein